MTVARCDKNLANLDAQVKSIIKETVKSQLIKKKSMMFDHSLIECELTYAVDNRLPTSLCQPLSKRSRQPGTIDLRSPPAPAYRKLKQHDGRNFTPSRHGNPKFCGNPRQNFAQSKGYFCSIDLKHCKDFQ